VGIERGGGEDRHREGVYNKLNEVTEIVPVSTCNTLYRGRSASRCAQLLRSQRDVIIVGTPPTDLNHPQAYTKPAVGVK